jgi:hypothetical protein
MNIYYLFTQSKLAKPFIIFSEGIGILMESNEKPLSSNDAGEQISFQNQKQ